MNTLFFQKGLAYRQELYSIKDTKVVQRYKSKIAECDGLDPYLITFNECVRNYSVLPSVTMVEIIMYLVHGTSFYTLQEFGAYKSLSSYKNFACGWVQDMVIKKLPRKDSVILMGLVKHSYKFNEDPLMVWILSKNNGTIVTAHCNCMAGLGEVCSHVGTLLFMVEHLVKSNEAKSVTDMKSKWPVPSLESIPFCTINHVLTSKKPVVDDLPQPLPQPLFTVNDIVDDVINAGLSPVLAKVIRPFYAKYVTNDIEDYDLDNEDYTFPTDTNDKVPPNIIQSMEHLNLSQYIDITIKDLQSLEKLGRQISSTITENEIDVIQRITKSEISQRNRPYWHAFRNGRITGSTFKSACVGNAKKPCKTTLKKICYSKDNNETLPKAILYGKVNENTAIKRFIEEFKVIHDNCTFSNCGLFISTKRPIFASTPDLLCSCSCCEEAVVEVKCPIRLSETGTILEFTKEKNSYIFINNLDMFDLKKNHEYYYQCQMEMFTTNRKLCYFMLWSPREYIQINIPFDEEFWKVASSKAENYLYKAAYPELLGHHFSKNQENFFS